MTRYEKLSWMCVSLGCHKPKEGRTDHCSSCNTLTRRAEREASRPVKTPTPLKRTPIKKVSPKRKEENTRYSRDVKKWKQGKFCVMCDWQGWKNTNVTNHHQMGRTNALLNDQTKWLPLCLKHHEWATKHSKEAIELGISLPRNHA